MENMSKEVFEMVSGLIASHNGLLTPEGAKLKKDLEAYYYDQASSEHAEAQ